MKESNPYNAIFKEIADNLLEKTGIKPNYSNNAMLDVCFIFQDVLMDKIFENQNYDKMEFEERCKMVKRCGEDLRKLIHTYTNLDCEKLVNNYNK